MWPPAYSGALPALLALDPTTAQALSDVRIDWRVQLSIASLAIAIATLSGLLPLIKVLRGNLLAGVANTSRRAIGYTSGPPADDEDDSRVRSEGATIEAACRYID